MALEILVLHSSSRCVEPDVLPVEVHPHRRDLRGSPGADGGDVGKGFLLEDVAVLRERSIRRHDRPPLSCSQAENAVSEHLSTFIGDVSIRPCSRSLSAFRPWMCISASAPVPPPFVALPRESGEPVCARLGEAPPSEQQTADALLYQQRVVCVRIAQPLAR